ncbi:MAG: PD40 domain-containing protein [Theionarchaea archaeon]|nr:PD40 domain-containing protein [Theionarchaea archaeon]MBU7000539.1 PD40 domain-containing protein [Theionarchaea archaeon]MBU7021582.1 PD40 domain-containing protein [Theionarchaea archaeon]MBU7034113.1 PD40 domain-containing protein [Theionarchaea archaeon]MBU7039952.1 PD40 domain-containing protein [Theionarchaea archaeon]
MKYSAYVVISFLVILALEGMNCMLLVQGDLVGKSVPREERWGIYAFDLATEEISLIYSSSIKISGLQLNGKGDTFVFSQVYGDTGDQEEICSIQYDGRNFRRLTDNTVMDTYPCWSPDGEKIAFLSFRETLDIYIMNSDGSNVSLLYDSGFHDGDINWVGQTIVFTRESQIWMMNHDGTGAHPVTNPPRAGEWGKAVLPFGDYDPRLSPDGRKIVFERLVDDKTCHGNYDIVCINTDGSSEHALTSTGYTQGLATWSHDGSRISYIVTAIGERGVYDLHIMNADGKEQRNVTPEYVPEGFLCHSGWFSPDDTVLFFVGEWWEKDTGWSAILAMVGVLLLLIVKTSRRE